MAKRRHFANEIKGSALKITAHSIGVSNEPKQSKLVIVDTGGIHYQVELNDDQLMTLLYQSSHVLWGSCKQVRRFKND